MITPKEEKVFFSMESGGILCSDCAAGKKKVSKVSADALYTMRYIVSEQMGKLYTFRVSEGVQKELEEKRKEEERRKEQIKSNNNGSHNSTGEYTSGAVTFKDSRSTVVSSTT